MVDMLVIAERSTMRVLCMLTMGLVAPAAALAQEGPRGEVTDFLSIYKSWDVAKLLWLLVTLAMAYAIATFAFLLLLGRRNPKVAARYALFWGGLALILIHAFAFPALLETGLQPAVIGAILGCLIIGIIVFLMFLRRKR